MKGKKKKRKVFSNRKEKREFRHLVADKLIDNGLTPEKFNKLMGFNKNGK